MLDSQVQQQTRQQGPCVFHHSADNLDDLMRKVFTRLLSGNKRNNRVRSRKGTSTELFGALLELTNPRARLGRSEARARVFSPLGELLWYLSGSDALDQINYYIEGYDEFSDDGETLNGAYGRRIFGRARLRGDAEPKDEWQRVIDTLRAEPGSRNAIIQIYANADGARNGADGKKSKDIPCTCTLHFVIRKKRLHLHVHMRSNDVFLGLPHDVFSFTMLQEIAARELGVEPGTYHHSVASLHLYDDTERQKPRTNAQKYVDEGLHDIVPMPPMPLGDPWPAVWQVLEAEREIRAGNPNFEPVTDLDPYWRDLIILLRVFALGTLRDTKRAAELLDRLNHDGFKLYVLDRIAKKKVADPVIRELFEPEEVDAQRNP
ncbi:MAG: thymidylate synthase [Mesorhizobium sp.]|uniref:thymidylate synthase n=1 Tax=Mesorhizobium sp. TaxID=1871066 RepID=UPI000FE9312B|nr:thymidylate synthase [Mesorhizobium sp.]RWN45270.1 MAG: thymidylate synthase [Mesorhizobium sp.]